MKKLFFMFASVVAICFASCGDKTTKATATTDTDSVAVDTLATDTIDSVSVDTTKVDTVAELAQD